MEPKKSIPFRERLGAFPVGLATGGLAQHYARLVEGFLKR